MKAGLNLYATSVDGFTDAAREAALRLAGRAAAVLVDRAAYDSAVGEVDHLRRAMDSRAVIDQAKGVLMFALGLSADEAFQALSQRSQHTNVKVQALAAHLVAGVTAGRGRAAVDELWPAAGEARPEQPPEG